MTAQFAMRLLIVSYFVALSLGLTQGADIQKLSDPFLPDHMSHYAMRGVVLTLAGMVLFDIQRRAAALILSVFVFWSSYLAIFLGGSIGDFWLDLALIGALLHIGGVGAEGEGSAARSDPEATRGPDIERRAISKPEPGGDLPYRKDLEAVRNL